MWLLSAGHALTHWYTATFYLLLPLIGTWFGIPDSYILLAILYCTVIPTMQAMTPGGVLRTLDRFGYRVLLAVNGAEAVAQYARQQNEIAAVITDMAMPIMDGPALILALRGSNPDVRIIGSSGLASDAGVAVADLGGAVSFVRKPYSAEALLRMIKDVLNDGSR